RSLDLKNGPLLRALLVNLPQASACCWLFTIWRWTAC
ncbi:hypothetical protein PSYMP_29581, partial [Pseudomonas amygdali pv. morsprunorum str. M302280]